MMRVLQPVSRADFAYEDAGHAAILAPATLDPAEGHAARGSGERKGEHGPERLLPAAVVRHDTADRQSAEEKSDIRELHNNAVAGGDVLRRTRMHRQAGEARGRDDTGVG